MITTEAQCEVEASLSDPKPRGLRTQPAPTQRPLRLGEGVNSGGNCVPQVTRQLGGVSSENRTSAGDQKQGLS